jgi:hypothetical protein
MKRLTGFLTSVITAITGSFSWTAPPWIAALNGLRKRKPLVFYSLLILFFIVGFGGIGGYVYNKKLPKTDLVVLKTRLNEINPPSDEITEPEPLYIDFSTELFTGQPPGSFARLDLAGKNIASGITIEPALEGTWSWTSDGRIISFQPRNQWDAEKKYTITVSPEILEKKIKLESPKVSFERHHSRNPPNFILIRETGLFIRSLPLLYFPTWLMKKASETVFLFRFLKSLAGVFQKTIP